MSPPATTPPLDDIYKKMAVAAAVFAVIFEAGYLATSAPPYDGLGYLIGFLGASGAYEGMFAVVLTVALAGFAADRAYGLLVRKALQWRE